MQKQIVPPNLCPSCDSTLVWESDILYCRNPHCSAKNAKIVEHFAKSLKIKGLGPKSIDKLGLESILDIYSMDRAFMVSRLGSTLVSDKMLQQIHDSKKAGLQELLPAFSIPLFGRTASDKLCKKISNVNQISKVACSNAGLGPKTTESLLRWYEKSFKTSYHTLPFSWQTVKTTELSTDGPEVVITGKLISYKTKEVAKTLLQEYGFVVKNSVTRNTRFLVNESGVPSAKTKKAEAEGISIINNINELLEKNYGST
jgi:DNA ligase (NAD+)